MPQALEDQYHGWESRQIVDDFVRYATILFEHFGDRVKHWIIMNEQNVFTGLGWMGGMHPPGKIDEEKLFYQVNHHAFMAHAKSVLALKNYIRKHWLDLHLHMDHLTRLTVIRKMRWQKQIMMI